MSIHTSEGTAHVGKTDQLSGFALPLADFNRIGDGLLTPNRELAMKGFPYAATFFSGTAVKLESLDAFLLLEELDILLSLGKAMSERDQEILLMIYNNVKYEVYNVQQATVSL